MNWDAFDKFEKINDKYLPNIGEGETMATQCCTAINKLVYRWYNDGDVYDNTGYLDGWCNDLSSYANWLYKYCDAKMLDDIYGCYNGGDYEAILWELACCFLNEEQLTMLDKKEKVGSIYKCEGQFKFEEYDDDDDWY